MDFMDILFYLFLFAAYGIAHNVRVFPRAPNKLTVIPQIPAHHWKVGEIMSVVEKRRILIMK